MIKDFEITKTKLIIWDLDDTFWNGTLSEGGIKFNTKNLQLIEELTTKGIMNSICSKNNYTDVKEKFLMNGYEKYWQMFLFPSIDWSAKGQRVKNIISSMHLREENVIFIDDNEVNINEVKFYCPKIMSATSEQVEKISKELYLVNAYDFNHKRLQEYKILEEKNKEQSEQNCSNEDFLRNSEIKICIKKDCKENIDRIDTLIHRTNQLNFTKNITDKKLLDSIFSNTDLYESAYIIAEDNYGNYGICGFYVLNKEINKLEHFLFSCRIMNMGIEQFIYKYLNSPHIDIISPVSSTLSGDVDWIEIVDNLEVKNKEIKKENALNILFKGACDLYSTISYIAGDCNIDTEFPYWNKQLKYISSHTHPAFIEQTHRLSENELVEISNTFPYPNPDEFKTEFFNPKYNVIILSLLQATYKGIYINQNNGHFAEYGFTNCDITDENNWNKILSLIPENEKEQNKMALISFKKLYKFAGAVPVDLILHNLQYIRDNLDKNTHLILILGSEIETSKILKGYEGVCEKHKILNKNVREFVKNYDNIDIVEITDLIKDEDDYSECINHFSRRIYAELAREIIAKINEKLKKDTLFLKTDVEPMKIFNGGKIIIEKAKITET